MKENTIDIITIPVYTHVSMQDCDSTYWALSKYTFCETWHPILFTWPVLSNPSLGLKDVIKRIAGLKAPVTLELRSAETATGLLFSPIMVINCDFLAKISYIVKTDLE